MNVERSDLRELRPAATLFVSLVLLGCGALAAGRHFAGVESAAYAQAAAEREQVGRRLRRIDDDANVIRDHADRYRQLAARGLLGPEQRLDWIERIGEVRRARQLFEPQYEFAPQRPLEPFAHPQDTAGLEFSASAMKLHLPLLHEHDLLHFLGDLADTAPALLRVRECRLERRPPSAAGNDLPAALTADCMIDWITVRERPA